MLLFDESKPVKKFEHLFLRFDKLNFSDFWGPQKLQFKAKDPQIMDFLHLNML